MNIPIDPVCGFSFVAASASCVAAILMRRRQLKSLAELAAQRASMQECLAAAIAGAHAARGEMEAKRLVMVKAYEALRAYLDNLEGRTDGH